jgi:cyclophilin family peptidyl-prolyl cis-trans isomerase
MRVFCLSFCLMAVLFGADPSWSRQKTKTGASATAPEIAVIETTFGTIEIELFRKDAPKTVHNFVELAKKGYFNRVKFHRIAKDFVIQTGDPTGTGNGGQSVYGKPFEDEIKGNGRFTKKLYKKAPGGNGTWFTYSRGTIAMANLGRPSTNTSQFFIILKDSDMPPQYTIFGRVVAGMDVVDRIAAVPIIPVMGSTDGKPKKDILMNSVTIRTK